MVFWSALLLALARAQQQQEAPVIQLDNLYIHGLQLTDTTGGRANAYVGIPFAEPPVGELRWTDPKPLKQPEEKQVFLARTLPPICPQVLPPAVEWLYEMIFQAGEEYNNNLTFTQLSQQASEDCLYLNVFTPSNNNVQRPVMVWVHGGAFISGSGGYDARSLAISQDVVVVTVQYRLGVFGFLNMGDSLGGNWGLKDQALAFHWVKKNIHAFGGDSSRVTCFGESAGSTSCAMHTVAPSSRGLFHNAILQSGTERSRVLYSRNSLQMAQRLAHEAQCETSDSSVLLSCLRQKSQVEVLHALQAVGETAQEQVKQGLLPFWESVGYTSFCPTFDKVFFPEDPLSTSIMNPVNLIVGYNSDELSFLMAGLMGMANPMSTEQLMQSLEFVAMGLVQGNMEYVPKFLDLLKLVYVGSEDAQINKKTAQRAMADMFFVANAFIKAEQYSAAAAAATASSENGHHVYVYELMRGLTLLQDHSLIDPSLVNKSRLPLKPADAGGDHTDDIPFMFGYPFNPNFRARGYGSTDGDKALSGLMMNVWGEFARTGVVRGWTEYSSRRTVMQLDRQEPYMHIAYDPHHEVLNLWGVRIPALFGEMVSKAALRKQDL